jgi:predicted acylesterase/phospholipase RssA
MPYPIEIIVTKPQLAEILTKALVTLNKVQTDFIYNMAPPEMQADASIFVQAEYSLDETFAWLTAQRNKTPGNHPFLILVVDGYLYGEYENLYGGHDAINGMAVFTTDCFDERFEQFLYDKIRYCRYYLVRYSLSFVDPEILVHQSSGCMFDNKIDKSDILSSLNSGHICDNCMAQLRSKINAQINTSIRKMLQIVSNQLPRALVMKGGGVKGIAFAGALAELEKHFTFDTFAGTSAGAITATLLGAGYKPKELEDILFQSNFDAFRDTHLLMRPINLLRKKGYHAGEKFKTWINSLLKKKLPAIEGFIKLKDLKFRTIVYATRIDEGRLTFDSHGDRKETVAAFAVRCSMSIPLFFIPTQVDDIDVFDGGLGNNFPLRAFIDDNQNKLFLGLYLASPIKDKSGLLGQLKEIAVDADERQVVNKHIDSIVKIDPFPIDTKEFSLSDDKKRFLIKCGRVGALRYLSDYHKDFGIEEDEVNRLSKELEKERIDLIYNHYRKKYRKYIAENQ